MKILVVLLHGIGDSLMAVPALHLLKEKHPGSLLSVMTINHLLFKELWKYNKDVDQVLFSSLKHNPRYGHPLFWLGEYWTIKKDIKKAVAQYNFDQVYFVKMFVTPAKVYAHLPLKRYQEHKSVIIGRELGIEMIPKQSSLAYGEEDTKWAQQYVKQNKLDSSILVGMHATGSSTNKSLPKEDVEKAIEMLTSLGYQVVLFDSPQSAERSGIPAKAVHYISDSILHSAALIDRCAFLVCVDSGVGHVAAALDKPLFSIYFKKIWMQNSLALGKHTVPYWYHGQENFLQHLHQFIQRL
jgi:ADP-heptose:LPS heptosyltransferase